MACTQWRPDTEAAAGALTAAWAGHDAGMVRKVVVNHRDYQSALREMTSRGTMRLTANQRRALQGVGLRPAATREDERGGSGR